jgi:hypothetical protein
MAVPRIRCSMDYCSAGCAGCRLGRGSGTGHGRGWPHGARAQGFANGTAMAVVLASSSVAGMVLGSSTWSGYTAGRASLSGTAEAAVRAQVFWRGSVAAGGEWGYSRREPPLEPLPWLGAASPGCSHTEPAPEPWPLQVAAVVAAVAAGRSRRAVPEMKPWKDFQASQAAAGHSRRELVSNRVGPAPATWCGRYRLKETSCDGMVEPATSTVVLEQERHVSP